MPTYPTDYPQPTWEYSQELTAYPERTTMECGWTRQRRTWVDEGSSVSLQFIMHTDQFDEWCTWVYANGYQYFTIALDRLGGVRVEENIRFVTPITYRYDAFDIVTVDVSGEFLIDI